MARIKFKDIIIRSKPKKLGRHKKRMNKQEKNNYKQYRGQGR
jgi:hypothetical protein